VAVSLLVQVYPLKTIVPMMVIFDICATLFVGRKSSSDVNLKELKWLFPFGLVGMIIGVVLLIKAPSEPLLILLGCFTVVNGARMLWQRNVAAREPINPWWAAPFGFIGGVFTALFATGGPVYASYLGLRIQDAKILRATMVFTVFILTILRLGLMLVTGLILQWPVLGFALCLLPATFLGIWLGTRVHQKLSNAAMQVAYGSLLLFAGTALLVRQLV